MTRLTNYKSKKIRDDLVLFRAHSEGRLHHYKRTYSKRMYFVGHRKFVIWGGMICWLRNAYKGHFVVWTMETPETALA